MDFCPFFKYTVLSSLFSSKKNMKHKTDKQKANKSGSLFHFNCRSVVFLWLFLIAMILFYAAGSLQQFLDSTQQRIVMLCFLTTTVLCFFSVTGLVQCLVSLFSKQFKKYLTYTIVYIISLVLSAAVLVFFQTLNFLAEGF